MNDTQNSIGPAAGDVANNSSVMPFPKTKRKRGRKPTRSPRCPVVHFHSPNDVRLLGYKLFFIREFVLRDSDEWAEIAIENGISDPIEALQFFLTSNFRAVFENGIADACARCWFGTKPSHREEKEKSKGADHD